MSDAVRFSGADSPKSIAAGALLTLAGGAIFSLMPVYLADMATAMSLTPQRAGVLAGSEIAGIAFASVLSLLWVKRISWRTLALTGALIACLGDLLTCLVQTYGLILAIRVMTGLFGEGILYPLSFAVLARTLDPARSFGIAQTLTVGLPAVVLLGSPWLTATFGSCILVLFLGAVAAVIIPTRNWVPYGPLRPSARVPKAKRAGGLWTALLFPLWGLTGEALWIMGPGGYWAFAQEVASFHGISVGAAATALSFSLAAGFIGCAIPARIGGRYGRVSPIVMSTLGLIGAVLASTSGVRAIGFAVYMMLFNITWNLGGIYVFGILASADRDGRLAVLIPASQTVGLAAGPIVMGYLIGRWGPSGLSWGCAAASLLSLVVFVPFAQRVMRPAPGASVLPRAES